MNEQQADWIAAILQQATAALTYGPLDPRVSVDLGTATRWWRTCQVCDPAEGQLQNTYMDAYQQAAQHSEYHRRAAAAKAVA